MADQILQAEESNLPLGQEPTIELVSKGDGADDADRCKPNDSCAPNTGPCGPKTPPCKPI